MCPGICPADATRYRSRGKSFKTTVCTAERRSNPEKQDQRGATHTHNQTQRQTNPTELFTYLSEYYWWVLGSCKYSLMAHYTPLISWCSRYGSLLFYIRLWWEGWTTHTHTHKHKHGIAVLHYPFPCWSFASKRNNRPWHCQSKASGCRPDRMEGGVNANNLGPTDTFGALIIKAFVWQYRRPITIKPWVCGLETYSHYHESWHRFIFAWLFVLRNINIIKCMSNITWVAKSHVIQP